MILITLKMRNYPNKYIHFQTLNINEKYNN